MDWRNSRESIQAVVGAQEEEERMISMRNALTQAMERKKRKTDDVLFCIVAKFKDEL